MAEAKFIARVTCRQIELVLIEVEALDRAGRRVMQLVSFPSCIRGFDSLRPLQIKSRT